MAASRFVNDLGRIVHDHIDAAELLEMVLVRVYSGVRVIGGSNLKEHDDDGSCHGPSITGDCKELNESVLMSKDVSLRCDQAVHVEKISRGLELGFSEIDERFERGFVVSFLYVPSMRTALEHY